jgi:hypothetical protein
MKETSSEFNKSAGMATGSEFMLQMEYTNFAMITKLSMSLSDHDVASKMF